MSYARYVLMVVIDPETRTVVGLVKKKGPKLLLNKITFPGGKLNAGETPQAAASREMLEETGVAVPFNAWELVGVQAGDDYQMHILAARSSEVERAETRELEPVLILKVDEHQGRACSSPEQYVHDFRSVLADGLKVLGLTQVESRPASWLSI